MKHNIKHLTKFLFLVGLLLLPLLCYLEQPLQATEWGDLSGQFIYNGKPFTPPKIEITKDQIICGKPGHQKKDQSLIIGKNGGIKNIFIYLRAPKLQNTLIHSSYQKMPDKVMLQHKKCIMEPHAGGLWYKHQKLLVINHDPIAHNTYVRVIKNQIESFIIAPGGIDKKTLAYHVNEPLPLRVVCHIHPWETAYLLVKNHPYFAITDDKGAFTIKNLPVGDWEFRLWHERTGYLISKKEWKRGRIKMEIKPGKNDLGMIKVDPEQFENK